MAPIDILRHLKSRLMKEQTPKAPPISQLAAAALSVAFTLIYVLPFYLSKATRPSPQLSRDAPSSIRARIRAVTISSILCSLLTIGVIVNRAETTPLDTLHLLGWWPISLVDVAKTQLLVAILFIGPLFEAGIVEGGLREWVRGTYIREVLGSWIGWRNYVAGPVTEELIWRSLIIPIHLLAHVPPKTIVFTTPLYFGIAHIHHYYEFRLTHPHTPTGPAVFRSLFQFAYTSIFGFFAGFVFLRNRSLLALILTHSFCNWMGFPRLWGRVGVEAGEPIGATDTNKKSDANVNRYSEWDGVRRKDLPVLYSIIYYLLLAVGAIGFYYQLFPLTSSSRALEKFE